MKQRIFGICLGYEDLNDHDQLRYDPLLFTAVGKTDPLGQNRIHEADRGKPLAGKSTLNRLELTPVGADEDSRYKKTVAHMNQIANFLVDVFLWQQPTPPKRIVLDLDSTDDPLHGQQLGRFFHGYYGHYCYLSRREYSRTSNIARTRVGAACVAWWARRSTSPHDRQPQQQHQTAGSRKQGS